MTIPSKVLCEICGQHFEPDHCQGGGASLQEHILICMAQDFDIVSANITATPDGIISAVCIEIEKSYFIDVYQLTNEDWVIKGDGIMIESITWGNAKGSYSNLYEALASVLLTL